MHSKSNSKKQTAYYRAICAVLGGLLGASINAFSLTLFMDCRLFLGGAVSMAVALMLGPLEGSLSAFISAVPIALYWHNPIVFLLFGMQAAVVPAIRKR